MSETNETETVTRFDPPPAGNVFKDGLGLMIQKARESGVPERDLKTMLQNAADKMAPAPEEAAAPVQAQPETVVEDSGEPKLRPVNS